MDKDKALRRYLQQAQALRDTMHVVLDSDSPFPFPFASFNAMARKYNAIAKQVAHYVDVSDGTLFYIDTDKMPGSHDSTGIYQMEVFHGVLADVSMLIAILEEELGVTESKIGEFKNFIRSRLRPAINKQPENEHDVQDAVEAILVGRGMDKGVDFDRERGRVKHSAKESVPDFILLKLGLALEVKFVSNAASRSAVIDGIDADIRAYQKAYSHLLFLVYDLGSIQDVEEFKRDLESADNVNVLVIKH